MRRKVDECRALPLVRLFGILAVPLPPAVHARHHPGAYTRPLFGSTSALSVGLGVLSGVF